MEPGDFITFPAPTGKQYKIAITAREEDSKGNITIIGSLDSTGPYRMTATIGKSGIFGRIQTPETTYQITVKNGKTILIDLYAPGNAVVPRSEYDTVIPSKAERVPEKQATNDTGGDVPEQEAVAPQVDGVDKIDIMILYTSGIASNYPGDLLETKFNYLVSVANTAYGNSNINTTLRLVHYESISYSEHTSNDAALDALTYGTSPFEGIDDLRTQHGADLVVLIRPYDYQDHGGCGIAWLLGTNGSFAGDSDYGYSVVGDGSEEVDGVTYYCTDLTMTHELGHNIGSTHDRANAGSSTPVYPYSYGYGIAGRFGTVMSYVDPETDTFSNPDLTCGPQNGPCGIDENESDAAHNTLSINNSSAAIAAFRQEQYSGDINDDGKIDLTDTIQALRISAGESPTGTINRYEDINVDGKIGIEEAIYTLQQQN